MISIICLLPWFFWIVGYPIYKKIKHEDVWESNIYVPVIWILCVLGNAASFIIAFCKQKFNFILGEYMRDKRYHNYYKLQKIMFRWMKQRVAKRTTNNWRKMHGKPMIRKQKQIFRFEVIGKGRHPPRGNKWILGRCTGRNNSMTMTCASANPHPQNRNTDETDI